MSNPETLTVLGPCVLQINRANRTDTIILHAGDDLTIIRATVESFTRPGPPPPTRVFSRLMGDSVAVQDRSPPAPDPEAFDPES